MPDGLQSVARAVTTNNTQASRLLPVTLEKLNTETRLHVLDFGPALPETINFFSNYFCKLHIVDFYTDLPLPTFGKDEDEASGLRAVFQDILMLPQDVKFDVIYFWDSINFLSRDALTMLMEILHPHLHSNTLAHCFAVHDINTPAAMEYYGIHDRENFSLRTRRNLPSGYQPHRQSELDALLKYLRADSSVLMRDRRVEILLKARL